ncbi:hypothetical protein MKW92_035732 [Papaver armeniacum]|nr:hypothetical protein MKW92_035732 [Papaver armeniacum]
MAKSNTFILCVFLVLLIFSASGGKAMNQDNKLCKETWETTCVTEEDCKDKCFRDHGSEATPSCLVRAQQGLRDLCYCRYNC